MKKTKLPPLTQLRNAVEIDIESIPPEIARELSRHYQAVTSGSARQLTPIERELFVDLSSTLELLFASKTVLIEAAGTSPSSWAAVASRCQSLTRAKAQLLDRLYGEASGAQDSGWEELLG